MWHASCRLQFESQLSTCYVMFSTSTLKHTHTHRQTAFTCLYYAELIKMQRFVGFMEHGVCTVCVVNADIPVLEDVWQNCWIWASAVLSLLDGRKRRWQDLCHKELVSQIGLDVVYDFDCVVCQNLLFYFVLVLNYGWFSGWVYMSAHRSRRRIVKIMHK